MYEFKMALFSNGETEEFLLFVHNLKMKINASGNIVDNINLWYLSIILTGEVIHQFDTLCARFGSTNMAHLKQVIFSLGTYFLCERIF